VSAPKQQLGTCVARVVPLNAKSMRACGKAAFQEVDGRTLCNKHAAIAKRRAQVKAEAGGTP
jgi:hypothetical protein